MELLSPFAPLWPWLVPNRESRIPGFLYRIFPDDCRPLGPADIGTPSERLIDGIDLRDLAIRAVVLRALAAHGHARPWALGEGWSDLTAEQAGRVVAEMVRRVGADPAKPVGVIPVAVLGARYRERGMSHEHRVSVAGEAFIAAVFGEREDLHPAWMIRRASTHVPLAEMARQPGWMPWDAQESCDAACVERGMLLWEQVTPCP